MSSKVDEEEILSRHESNVETKKEEILMRDIEFENLNAE